jgi:hypothetical protein
MNDVDPQAWLADLLARLPDYPANQVADLLPWNWKANRQSKAAIAACCLSDPQRKIAPTWGAGRVRTEKIPPSSQEPQIRIFQPQTVQDFGSRSKRHERTQHWIKLGGNVKSRAKRTTSEKYLIDIQ